MEEKVTNEEEINEPTEASPSEAPASDQQAEQPPASEEADTDQQAEQAPATEQLSEEQLRSVLEVLLLVTDRPLSMTRIKEIIKGISDKQVQELILQIKERLLENDFPYQIREVGGGYVLSTLSEYAPWVRRLFSPKTRATRLSQAALETLAVIAYKQPVTRGEIEAIRGVSVDSTLKTLLEKRLCEIVGYKDVVGKPATYGTTSEFLLHFGLNALTDLPSIEELRRSDSDK